MHVKPVQVDCDILIGASGAVTSIKGSAVKSVTKLATGTYQIKLMDNYSNFYQSTSDIVSPPSGSNIAVTSALTVGNAYVITVVGTTTLAGFQSIGLSANAAAPAVGQGFICTSSTPTTGTGQVQLVSPSTITAIELISAPLIAANTAPANVGSEFILRCYAATNSSTTTLIPTNPPSGSVLGITLLLSDSSVIIQGE